jgi:hypothetical protein
MVLGVVTKMVSSASSSEADTLIKIEQLSPTAQRMYMVREIMRSSQRIVWTFVLCGLFLYVVLSSVDDTIRQMVVGFCSLVIGFLFVDRARK